MGGPCACVSEGQEEKDEGGDRDTETGMEKEGREGWGAALVPGLEIS